MTGASTSCGNGRSPCCRPLPSPRPPLGPARSPTAYSCSPFRMRTPRRSLPKARPSAAAVPGSRLLAGDAATSDALRQRMPGPAALHIACHGLYRSANPLFSSLRLGDRWVTSAEIMELDLDGALVALSACESGRPADDTAEPVGLAWAFLAAGASGAVVSRWIVHDDAAADLFGAFYTRLAAGVPPSCGAPGGAARHRRGPPPSVLLGAVQLRRHPSPRHDRRASMTRTRQLLGGTLAMLLCLLGVPYAAAEPAPESAGRIVVKVDIRSRAYDRLGHQRSAGRAAQYGARLPWHLPGVLHPPGLRRRRRPDRRRGP